MAARDSRQLLDARARRGFAAMIVDLGPRWTPEKLSIPRTAPALTQHSYTLSPLHNFAPLVFFLLVNDPKCTTSEFFHHFSLTNHIFSVCASVIHVEKSHGFNPLTPMHRGEEETGSQVFVVKVADPNSLLLVK
ncbi:hypothetical protein NL676_012897 [Syzygium grande]|nr:hypothetical protein NL676_012897 [Syzygium grande]